MNENNFTSIIQFYETYVLKIAVTNFCSLQTHPPFSIQLQTFPEIEGNKLLAVFITRCKYSAGPL